MSSIYVNVIATHIKKTDKKIEIGLVYFFKSNNLKNINSLKNKFLERDVYGQWPCIGMTFDEGTIKHVILKWHGWCI